MKKFNSKQKVIKNNQKISSFFNRISKDAPCNSNQNVTHRETDTDIIPATPTINNKKQKYRILNTITNKDECSKRKITSPDIASLSTDHLTKSPPKKKFNGGRENIDKEVVNDSNSATRSHSSNGNIVRSPSPKKFIREIIACKNGKLLDNIEIPSPKCDSSKKIIKEMSPESPRTPKKTPNKARSPRKLYSRSPKVNDFNVEIIENFVKITPSKSSVKSTTSILRTNSPTKQLSILKYMSPCTSKSEQVQLLNENTPEKTPVKLVISNSSIKVKKNLNLEFASTSSDVVDNTNTKPDILMQGINKTADEMKLLLSMDDSWERYDIKYSLDLSTMQYCKIIDLMKAKNKITITVEGSKSNEKALCSLEGFWIWSKLDIGCMVYITAVREHDNDGNWKITNDNGLLVYEPSVLISNTAVVGALFCKRRSVLKEKFMGFEPENKVMIVGVLIHSLLQNALQMKCVNVQQIENILNKILSSRNTIRMMYNSSLTLEDIRSELMQFIPRIFSFIKDYVLQQTTVTYMENNWKGTIDSIQDIEENIWCPEIGIKGKVDVSIASGKNILPVEVKTGRATVSLEHRGQVMLYIVMMSKLGYNVSSGLLLYLREGVLREIPYNEREKRDLILLRNELTYYLKRKVHINSSNSISNSTYESNRTEDSLEAAELPEPINHHSACEKCPYNVICCTYLRYQKVDISNNKVLNTIKENNLSHLSDSHVQYFIHFCKLLDLEGSEKAGKDVSLIYTKEPKERENYGKCITFVKITKEVIECNNLYEHTFEKSDSQYSGSFFASGIEESSYVVVSTNQRPAVAAGLVSSISHKVISITLDRNLNLKYSNSVFHIDSYNSTGAFSFNFTSLSIMLEATENAERLRRLIIDKEPPTFKLKLPKIVASKAPAFLKKLNKAQQRAVIRAIAANDYLLIKGMPGAGKTATIVVLVQLLVELGSSVLITSHTHSAVDNVCVRLKKCGINVLRLGALGKIHPEIQPFSEYELTKDCKTPEELEQIYNNAKVLAVTCLGAKHPVFNKRVIDICIVDESTQAIQCTVLRAISASKKFLLIGDPDQLPPVVRNKDAQKYGLSESLFQRLQNPKNTATLNLNYRMNKCLTKLANALTYKGELEVANDAVGCATLKIPNLDTLLHEYAEQQWILETLDQSLDKTIQVLDTGPVWLEKLIESENTANIYVNKSEVSIVVSVVNALLKGGVSNEVIGVISPYSAQVSEISITLQDTEVDVSTIDKFQGRDKEIIIFSCTLSKNLEKLVTISQYHILEDKKRLNVAITRAKHKLIFVCDLETMNMYTPFRQLFQHIPQQNFVRLKTGEKGFRL